MKTRRQFLKSAAIASGLIWVPKSFSQPGIIDAALARSSGSADITNGLIDQQLFTEGSGTTAADSSGNGNTMTLVSSPTWSTDPNGKPSITFTGANYGTIADTATLQPTAITMTCWVKPTALTNVYSHVWGKVLDATNAYHVFIKSNGKLAVYVSTVSGTVSYDGTGSHTLVTGTYYFVAWTYDSTAGLTGYVNGASDGTAGATGNLKTLSGGTVLLGNDTGNANRFLSGLATDARIYNRVLSSAEITTLFNNGAK